MTYEFTITGQVSVDGCVMFTRDVAPDPMAIYRFAFDAWKTCNQFGEWQVEFRATSGFYARPPDPVIWTARDAPMIKSGVGFIPEVIHRYTEMQDRIRLEEREEQEDD